MVVSLCLELVKPLQATFKISATGLRGRLHDAYNFVEGENFARVQDVFNDKTMYFNDKMCTL